MKFEFNSQRESTPEYDNHGINYCTRYRLPFKVDGIDFTATYRDLYNDYDRTIDLWHGNKLIAEGIRRTWSVHELGKIYATIKDAFKSNVMVNRAFHEIKSKIKSDTLDVMKDKMCKDLLTNDDWS